MLIDHKQILPNLPRIHPEKAVSSICSAKREVVLGMLLVQVKPLCSPAPCRAWQGSGIPQYSSSIIKHFLAFDQPFYSQGEPSLATSVP